MATLSFFFDDEAHGTPTGHGTHPRGLVCQGVSDFSTEKKKIGANDRQQETFYRPLKRKSPLPKQDCVML